MYEYMKGTLVAASVSKAVIDIQGVGYRLFIPFNNYAKLPALGAQVSLYVSTIIREDAHTLYGFLTQHERELFENLIEISGIGPKTALALVGHMELHDLQSAISQGNVSAVCKIPGIGKKTAERLIIEMRDKIFKISDTRETPAVKGENGLMADGLSALINLGYNSAQAQKALKTAMNSLPAESGLTSLITAALRCI